MRVFLILVSILLISSSYYNVKAFYVSISSPIAYRDGEKVSLYINKIFSGKTQLAFAYGELPFVCQSQSAAPHKWLNLGEILRGDRIMLSDHDLKMNQDKTCVSLCSTPVLPGFDLAFVKQLISLEYKAEWIIDDLPAYTEQTVEVDGFPTSIKEMGFPLGSYNAETDQAFYYNHINMEILYEKQSNDLKSIVAFRIIPESLTSGCSNNPLATSINQSQQQQPFEIGEDSMVKSITYTYSVAWKEETNLKWKNRWEGFISGQYHSIHWYSIINGLVTLGVLVAIVAIVVIRTISHGVSENAESQKEISTVDLFKPPKYVGVLCALVGGGLQFLIAATVTLVLAMFGILNPGYRGGLGSTAAYSYIFLGPVSGYLSSRLLKTMKGRSWVLTSLITATIIPTIMLSVVFLLNLFVWYHGSSNAIPFGTFFALALLLIAVSTPLTLVGSFYGFRLQAIEHPSPRSCKIPTQNPIKPWYLHPFICIFITGFISFSIIFLELFFVLKSVWLFDQFYYTFGFLGMIFLIHVLTTSLACILVIYITLPYITTDQTSLNNNNSIIRNDDSLNHPPTSPHSASSSITPSKQNPHTFPVYAICDLRPYAASWHWYSFILGSSPTIFVSFYLIYFFIFNMEIHDDLSCGVYFVYSVLGLVVYGLCSGAIGLTASYYFFIKLSNIIDSITVSEIRLKPEN